MTDRLDLAMLHRPALRERIGKIERHTVDFLVNGVSLFSATNAGQQDVCGCFSPDYATCGNELARDENERLARIFTFESRAPIAPDRVALFICPECGDLGCGAITFKLSRGGGTVRWSEFAYENNYDPEETNFERYAAIGPFEFTFDAYRAVIARAASSEPLSAR
jgi:hypothetical protein